MSKTHATSTATRTISKRGLANQSNSGWPKQFKVKGHDEYIEFPSQNPLTFLKSNDREFIPADSDQQERLRARYIGTQNQDVDLIATPLIGSFNMISLTLETSSEKYQESSSGAVQKPLNQSQDKAADGPKKLDADARTLSVKQRGPWTQDNNHGWLRSFRPRLHNAIISFEAMVGGTEENPVRHKVYVDCKAHRDFQAIDTAPKEIFRVRYRGREHRRVVGIKVKPLVDPTNGTTLVIKGKGSPLQNDDET